VFIAPRQAGYQESRLTVMIVVEFKELIGESISKRMQFFAAVIRGIGTISNNDLNNMMHDATNMIQTKRLHSYWILNYFCFCSLKLKQLSPHLVYHSRSYKRCH
jgi:hypothetical protein